MTLNCVITDDEPVALEILEDYIRMVPELNLVAKCKDAIETFSVLRQNQVDVLFIDIQMPEVTGLDLIRSLKKRPAIVFTTAYTSYAHEGFELDAVDYLLKPISIERFLRTADKLISQANMPRPEQVNVRTTADKKYFFIKVDQDLVKIELQKILYIEGLENYVKIICEDKTYVSFCTMRSMEEMLSPHRFLRIHRSYIVNLDKVDSIQNHIFMLKGKGIVTGKSYRKTVSELLKHYYSV